MSVAEKVLLNSGSLRAEFGELSLSFGVMVPNVAHIASNLVNVVFQLGLEAIVIGA